MPVRHVSSHPARHSPGSKAQSRRGWQVTLFKEFNRLEWLNEEDGLVANVSRRRFLKTSALAGGGLILGVHLPQLAEAAEASGQTPSPFALNAFVRIGTDDSVTVIVNHSE